MCQLKLLKNIDSDPRIKGSYSVYMCDVKLGMHVPTHFYLPGNTKCFNARRLWLDVNPGYRCTNAGGEIITVLIRLFMKFTADSIHKQLWNKFNNVWKKIIIMMDSAPGNGCVSDFVSNE